MGDIVGVWLSKYFYKKPCYSIANKKMPIENPGVFNHDLKYAPQNNINPNRSPSKMASYICEGCRPHCPGR